MQDQASSGAAGRTVHRLAEAVAILGGLCLVGAAVLTGISIAGSLVYRPLPGEIELVEILCGLAVFAFLPYCQLHKGHVGVDILINAFGPKAINWTQLIGDVVITVLLALLAWRHLIGTMDKFRNGEFTPILFIPLWWGFAAGFVLLLISIVVSAWTVLADIRDIRRGVDIELPLGGHG
jgi:TRAP-type C4-dicarboxylate transport system permease small subunit